MTEFPGFPVVRTMCFHCQGPSSVPGQGTKIPQAVQYSQKKKKCKINFNNNMDLEVIILSEVSQTKAKT